MVDRFVELIRAYTDEKKVIIDLEQVANFCEPHCVHDKGMTVVFAGSQHLIEMHFEDFKQLHAAYHASKQPITISSQWDPTQRCVLGKLTTTPPPEDGDWLLAKATPENSNIPCNSIITTNTTNTDAVENFRMQGTGYWDDPITLHKKTVQRTVVAKKKLKKK
jgi:hypothetical protein